VVITDTTVLCRCWASASARERKFTPCARSARTSAAESGSASSTSCRCPPLNNPSYRTAETSEATFDALYAFASPGLVHQIRLLTGRRGFAFEAVEHAFHTWEHWPDVAMDADSVGWVRAHAYDYTLSPWHRWRPALRRTEPAPTGPIAQPLLEIPATYRRTALLCDRLGLTLSEAATETEGTTAATRTRLLHARNA